MPQSPGAVRASVLVSRAALTTLAVGLIILAGGPDRFLNPSFATARAVAPWWSWGLAMTVSGVLASIGAVAHMMWMSRLGHLLSSIVYLFLVMTFVDGAMKSLNSPLTGIVIYTGFAMIHAFSAASADLERDTREAAKLTKEARLRHEEAVQTEDGKRES
jgi:uncharacterized membrane protein HdeD (DUF308 family)